jgi:hypothetical protein
LDIACRTSCFRPNTASLGEMDLWVWWLVAVGACLVLYAALVLALVIAGRRESARALAGFIPDCVVLCGRLLGDPRVPRRKKALLLALTGYLALPFDVVPDFTRSHSFSVSQPEAHAPRTPSAAM